MAQSGFIQGSINDTTGKWQPPLYMRIDNLFKKKGTQYSQKQIQQKLNITNPGTVRNALTTLEIRGILKQVHCKTCDREDVWTRIINHGNKD